MSTRYLQSRNGRNLADWREPGGVYPRGANTAIVEDECRTDFYKYILVERVVARTILSTLFSSYHYDSSTAKVHSVKDLVSYRNGSSLLLFGNYTFNVSDVGIV
jgi:hypothetical protein